MIPRAAFLESVRACVGTEVGHRGRTIGGALDCVGVPWAACKAIGLTVPETADYHAWPTGDQLTTGLLAYCDRTDELEQAHLLQVYVGRQARHVVVPVGFNDAGEQLVVHAWGKSKRVELTTLTYTIAQMWRIRGVE